jgi:hypothetical protein
VFSGASYTILAFAFGLILIAKILTLVVPVVAAGGFALRNVERTIELVSSKAMLSFFNSGPSPQSPTA